jgi:hypothetical protein
MSNTLSGTAPRIRLASIAPVCTMHTDDAQCLGILMSCFGVAIVGVRLVCEAALAT